MTELLKFDQISYNEPVYWLEQQWGRKLEPHEKNIVILIYRYTRTSQEAEEIKILEHRCSVCKGVGYTEYETGVTDGFIKEIAKEPCDCRLPTTNVNNVDKSCVLCQDAAERVDLKGQLFCNQCFEDVYL